jgi:uncharacterized membrane protein YkvA (DUF1232 family)
MIDLPAAAQRLPDPARQAALVEVGFWPKLRRLAVRLPFAHDLLAAYYATLDPATPARVRAVLMGALAYFVLPADLVPDVLIALGYTDDAAVLAAAVRALAPHILPAHHHRARQALQGLSGAAPATPSRRVPRRR